MTLHRFLQFVWPAVMVFVAVHLVMAFSGVRATNPKLWSAWKSIYLPVFAIYQFLGAIDALQRKDYVSAVICAGVTAYVAHMWWNDEDNRRKRKKLRDRAASRVANIAGRLRVVRPAEG